MKTISDAVCMGVPNRPVSMPIGAEQPFGWMISPMGGRGQGGANSLARSPGVSAVVSTHADYWAK